MQRRWHQSQGATPLQFIFQKILEPARTTLAGSGLLAFSPAPALAHASEGGFVLLLPTDVYIAAGGASVALTVLILALTPPGAAEALFRSVPLLARPRGCARHLLSLLSAVFLAWLVWRGLSGPRDPTVNPLPLMLWVVWWVLMVSAQGLFGDHWRFTNPWTGPGAALRALTGQRAPLRWPRALGHWPALVGFLGFAGFLLADIAPTDPGRLALVVGVYWCVIALGMVLFGPAFLLRAEALTVIMRAYGRMAMFGRARGRRALGMPGWQVLARPGVPLSLAVLMVVLLGCGSFDGLNETFWWLGILGLNPLEFPGRSVIVGQTLAGLALANLGLLAAFAGYLWLGERLAGARRPLAVSFRRFAPAILPIALGYHLAHYLTVLLVDGQYVLKWLGDPLGRGMNLWGLAGSHVTTGFLHTPGTVKAIWLTQAGAVVTGHVIAILLAHALALRDGGGSRRAVLGQAPLAVFMIGYTIFGLWLLASPRGV